MQSRRTVLLSAAAATACGRGGPALAQGPGRTTELLAEEGRYLPRWLELLEDSSDFGRAIRPQFAAFVGNEIRVPRQRRSTTTPVTLSADARTEDAVKRIVTASAGRRVVMLNEAHDAPRHRSFLARLLRALRPEGFTHLAAETFANSTGPTPDIVDYRAGRPFNPGYGWYTWDPVFAEAVREAAELGYGFMRYEERRDQEDPKATDSKARIARREQSQADNFIAQFSTHPGARVLVYVGYSHLREGPDPGGNVWFAARLKEKSGIDPLTIEQSATGSFGPHAPDPALTQAILNRFRPTVPIIVEDGTGVLGARSHTADLAVFHPNLPDVSGRPGWLAADPKRRLARATIPADLQKGLVLVQALHASDPEVAVPADQYLAPYGAREAVFFLRPGRYRVRLETETGFRQLGRLTV